MARAVAKWRAPASPRSPGRAPRTAGEGTSQGDTGKKVLAGIVEPQAVQFSPRVMWAYSYWADCAKALNTDPIRTILASASIARRACSHPSGNGVILMPLSVSWKLLVKAAVAETI